VAHGTGVAAYSFVRVLLMTLLLARMAHAEGVYFSQTVGVGHADEPSIGRALRTRASIGARVRWLAVETWVASNTRPAREDAAILFVGGEPRAGSDLASYGVATRAIAPLHRTRDLIVEGYLRANAGVATATGELAGFGGHTFGGGGGFQIRGRVRALGFAWAPLFFVERGPHVTGALFVDTGLERVTLRAGERSLAANVSQLAIGFAVGSTF
jgi:hypothetical protein